MKLRGAAKPRIRCRDLGEDQLIAQLVGGLRASDRVLAGPGDDCAVLRGPRQGQLVLLKTDCVVEGVHFLPNEKATRVGWKAMMRTLSDFAAMAGSPQFAVISLVTPKDREVGWMMELYRGLERAATRFGVAIVGGETSESKGPVVISVSAVGSVEKNRCVFRHGGRAGDVLFVTGKLGDSSKGRHLDFVPRIEEARWLASHFRIHAMMDLSDGLGADLPRLAKASGVGFRIEFAALPRARGCSVEEAIGAGEDYELLFALAPGQARQLEKKWARKFPRLRLTKIGVLQPRNSPNDSQLPDGFVHFR